MWKSMFMNTIRWKWVNYCFYLHSELVIMFTSPQFAQIICFLLCCLQMAEIQVEFHIYLSSLFPTGLFSFPANNARVGCLCTNYRLLHFCCCSQQETQVTSQYQQECFSCHRVLAAVFHNKSPGYCSRKPLHHIMQIFWLPTWQVCSARTE